MLAALLRDGAEMAADREARAVSPEPVASRPTRGCVVVSSTMTLAEAQKPNGGNATRLVLAVCYDLETAHRIGVDWFHSRPADVFWYSIETIAFQ
jgi:hypothetical protein